ncbi:MAG: hypothetical protein JJT85_07960 [Chromatiales bacterium]|nr:hypothetical protein [Chromatiales bacterium]
MTMWTRASKVSVLCAAIVAGLAGCGGGGGGGSAQARLQNLPPLPLDSSVTFEASQRFLTLVDLALSLALTGVDLLDAYEESAGYAQEQAAALCTEGGSATVRLQDHDGDGLPGTGDLIELVLTGCRYEGIASTGVLAVHIDSLSLDDEVRHASVSTQASGLQFLVGGITAEVSARLDTYHRRDTDSERIELAASWLEIVQPGAGERISRLALSFEQRYDTFRYSLSLNGRISSLLLGGWMDFSTALPLSGELRAYPDAGQIELDGAAQSRIVMTAGPGGSNSILELSLTNSSPPAPQISFMHWPAEFAVYWLEPLRPDAEPPPLADPVAGRLVPLGAPGGDIVADPARGRFYVTVPERNELLVLSMNSLQVIERRPIAGQPQRMRRGQDGRTLYITAHAGGAVIALDLESGAEQRFVISPELGTAATWDVLEYAPGRLLVTGSSSSFNYVVDLDTVDGSARRVADSVIARNEPELAQHPGDPYVYLREWRGLSQIRRLDTSQGAIPVTATAGIGRAADTAGRLVMTPDGTRLVQPDGRVVLAADLTMAADLQVRGLPAFSSDQAELWIWRLAGSGEPERGIQVFDAGTLEPLRAWQPLCGDGPQRMIAPLEDGRWALLVGDALCLIDTDEPAEPPGTGGGLPPAPPPTPVAVASRLVLLADTGFAMAFDAESERAYVSLPDQNVVTVIDAANAATLASIPFAAAPRGVALSADRSELFVALDGAGSVAVVDTSTLAVSEMIGLSEALGSDTAWDVAEAGPGRLLVTSGSTLTPLVQVLRNEGNSVVTVSQLGLRRLSLLSVAPDGVTAFAFDQAVPGSLYSLDLTQPAPAAVRRHAHAILAAIDPLAIAPDSSRLYTGSGQVLDAGSTMPVGLVSPGAPRVTGDGAYVMVTSSDGRIRRYARTTETLAELWETGCGVDQIRQLEANADHSRWVLRRDRFICVIEAP